MEVDQKLGMSLDDLIKNDKSTKQAVKQSRFRGRDRRDRKPSKDVKKVKRDTSKIKKDSDADMADRTSKNKERRNRDERRNKDNKDTKKSSAPGKKTKIVLTSKAKAGSEQKKKVKITNIPYDVTWRDVKEAFAKTAPVERCDVEKGEATIVFKTHADALKAIQTYNGGNMNGRQIKAFFD